MSGKKRGLKLTFFLEYLKKGTCLKFYNFLQHLEKGGVNEFYISSQCLDFRILQSICHWIKFLKLYSCYVTLWLDKLNLFYLAIVLSWLMIDNNHQNLSPCVTKLRSCFTSQLALRIGLNTAAVVSLTNILIGWGASNGDNLIITYSLVSCIFVGHRFSWAAFLAHFLAHEAKSRSWRMFINIPQVLPVVWLKS